MVREGLTRLEGVISVSERPDDLSATCEMQTVDGILLEPNLLASRIRDTRVGATLRGMEITVDGRIERSKKGLILRVRRYPHPLELISARNRIQRRGRGSGLAKVTKVERKAYTQLRRRLNREATFARITGRLEQKDSRLTLQVYRYEIQPTTLE